MQTKFARLLSSMFVFFVLGAVSPDSLANTISATIWQPGSGSVTKPSFHTTISGIASGGTGIARVEYYINGVFHCSTRANPYFNCSYKTPSASGTYTITMKAIDSSGASASVSHSFFVGSSTAPTPVPTPAPTPTSVNSISATIWQPGAGSNSEPNFYTTISGAASGGTGIARVEYYINGSLHCTTTANPYFNCAYKTPSTSGTHTITMKAIDTSGASKSVSHSFNVASTTASTPAPTPVPTPTPAPIVTAPQTGTVTVSPSSIVQGQSTSLRTSVVVPASGTYHLQMVVYNSASQIVGGVYRENVWLVGGTPYVHEGPWATAINTATGTYTVSVGVFSQSWSTLSWRDRLASISVTAASTTPTATPPPSSGVTNTVTPALPGYSLYFADEFDDKFSGGINTAVWDYGAYVNINNEPQCYTDARRENVRVETRSIDGRANGVLVLQARRENFSCAYAGGRVFEYTSGSIESRKKFWGNILVDMPHGRYEIRARVPDTGRGTWPAIWLLGDSHLGSWPNSGEIDIMEQYGSEAANGKQAFHSTLHRNAGARPWPTELGSPAGSFTGMGHTLSMSEPVGARFRVFALEWTPTSLEFFVDGVRVTKRTIWWDSKFEDHMGFFRDQIRNSYDDLGWPYGRPMGQNSRFYMILNLALQPGQVDPTQFDRGPVEFLVDYVRVYRRN